MSKRQTLTLRWEQCQELEEARDHDRRPSVRERGAALLKFADGYTAHAVARQGLLIGPDPDTEYAWLDDYQAVRWPD
jgi:hypothetical protein